MSDAAMTETPGMGHNQPVTDIEALSADLRDTYRDLTTRQDELVAGFNNVPTEVYDDDTSGKIGDYIKQLDSCIKGAEAARSSEKAPFLDGGRLVDGFFNKIKETLSDVRKVCADRDRIYKEVKEERERQERIEAERIAKEKAERLRAEAEERERIAVEAAQRAQREKEEAERKLREEQEARERDRQAAIDAANEAANEAERVRLEAEAAVQRKLDAAAARVREQEEKDAATRRKAETRQAEREKREAAEEAKRAETAAAKATKAAGAGSAELSRTRGEYGSVGGLRTVWIHDETSVDRKKLNLEELRQHIPEAALHAAIRSFIKAGGRKLRGCKILEERASTYR